MVVTKRAANADRDIPACFANSATVHPCRTSECIARSAPEMGASRNPAIRPGGKESWPRLGQRSASTSIACKKRCSQAHPSGSFFNNRKLAAGRPSAMACLVSRFRTVKNSQTQPCDYSRSLHSLAGRDVSHLLETKWLPVPRPSETRSKGWLPSTALFAMILCSATLP